jgi:hypothetical protein
MRIALVADTHNNMETAAVVAAQLHKTEIEAVLHAGDFTTPDCLACFAGLPVHAVFGNNDWDRAGLLAVAEEHGFSLRDFQLLTFGEVRIYLCHGHTNRAVKIVRDREADIVVFGHTHRRQDEMRDGVRLINPGALRRAESYTYALLTLPEGALEYVTVLG